jgi:hypothetical protein
MTDVKCGEEAEIAQLLTYFVLDWSAFVRYGNLGSSRWWSPAREVMSIVGMGFRLAW